MPASEKSLPTSPTTSSISAPVAESTQLSSATMEKLSRLLKPVNLDRQSNPALTTLPEWVEGFRPQQAEVIDKIIKSFRAGNDVVVLDAPTGTGKTLIAETVRRLMGLRTVYLCTSLSLQDQFARDYPYAKVLKGRANYVPLGDKRPFPRLGQYDPGITCEDCTAIGSDDKDCDWCSTYDVCPYNSARTEAAASSLSVLNTSYFLRAAQGYHSPFTGVPLIILDEADILEKELMNYVSVNISPRRLQELGIGTPEKITIPNSWLEWLRTKALPAITSAKTRLPVRSKDIRTLRRRRSLDILSEGIRTVEIGLAEGNSWVYTGDRERVEFKPITVNNVGEEAFWKHGSKFLIMSASIISPERLLRDTGYGGKYQHLALPSTFPPENRRIFVSNSANMSQKANERDKLAISINSILARHPDDRVLIHTVSTDLARFVHGEIDRSTGREIFSYQGREDRTRALHGYVRSSAGILVAQSFDRGIDLPDELCRVQIIAKIPFPYLGDRQVSARLYASGGQHWYTVQTIRTIIQMCGRAVRSADDWAVTYVLDSQFMNLWNKYKLLFPEWFREGIVIGENNG